MHGGGTSLCLCHSASGGNPALMCSNDSIHSRVLSYGAHTEMLSIGSSRSSDNLHICTRTSKLGRCLQRVGPMYTTNNYYCGAMHRHLVPLPLPCLQKCFICCALAAKRHAQHLSIPARQLLLQRIVHCSSPKIMDSRGAAWRGAVRRGVARRSAPRRGVWRGAARRGAARRTTAWCVARRGVAWRGAAHHGVGGGVAQKRSPSSSRSRSGHVRLSW